MSDGHLGGITRLVGSVGAEIGEATLAVDIGGEAKGDARVARTAAAGALAAFFLGAALSFLAVTKMGFLKPAMAGT